MTKWQDGVDTIQEARKSYTPERLAYYAEQTAREFAFFKFQPGNVLDVGCGDGCPHLFPGVHYCGVDVVPTRGTGFPFQMANAEALPFEDWAFKNVLCRSVLQHVQDPDKALMEMARVLEPGGFDPRLCLLGGHLCIEVCIDDPNPIFLHLWNKEQALGLIGKHFVILEHDVFERRLLVVNAAISDE